VSAVFWLGLAASGQGILIVVLFVRVARLETLMRNMLTGWGKRGR
jgi:hypothetical protein